MKEIDAKEPRGIYRRFIKRPMDFIVSLFAIVFLCPVLLILAILVRIKLGSPILFKQQRPGRDEKIFTMYKFRTMTDKRDNNNQLLPDSERLTRFGKMLRSTSLDELPELFNILKGDMSIVGPRPLALQYLPFYSETERLRHSVRPGLSGLAQVNGRNTTEWEKRFQYDIKYVNRISFVGDLTIIIKTALIAVKRTDIGERGKDAPMDFDEQRRNEIKEEVL